MSLRCLSGITARKQACTTVLISTGKTFTKNLLEPAEWLARLFIDR